MSINDEQYIWNPLQKYKILNFSIYYEKFLINESDEKIKDNPYRKLYLELLKFREHKKYMSNNTYSSHNSLDEIEGDEDIHTQSINCHETKMKSYLEENMYMKKHNSNKDTKQTTRVIHHKQSPSYNFENTLKINKSKLLIPSRFPLNNTTIQCNNNIENFYFNNFNISTDELKNKFGNLNLEASCGNINIKNMQINNSINSVHSIGSIKSMQSVNNSMNTSNFNYSPNPFISENFTNRLATNIPNMEKIRKSTIVNLKQSAQLEKEKERFNYMSRFDKSKNNISRANDFSEFVKFTKFSTSTSRNTNFNTQQNQNDPVLTESSNRKFRFSKIKDPNSSINISPFKRAEILDLSSNSIKNTHNNLSKIKNVQNLSKLVGDEEPDIFSDCEGENHRKRK
jgi:hypothetical protein